MQPEDYINFLNIHDAAEYQDRLDSRATNSPLSDTSSHSMNGERSMHVKVIKGLPKNFFIPLPPKESYEDFIHHSETESGQATPDSGILMVQSASVCFHVCMYLRAHVNVCTNHAGSKVFFVCKEI